MIRNPTEEAKCFPLVAISWVGVVLMERVLGDKGLWGVVRATYCCRSSLPKQLLTSAFFFVKAPRVGSPSKTPTVCLPPRPPCLVGVGVVGGTCCVRAYVDIYPRDTFFCSLSSSRYCFYRLSHWPNPPLRLARRPNRGHIGGGPLCFFFSRRIEVLLYVSDGDLFYPPIPSPTCCVLAA